MPPLRWDTGGGALGLTVISVTVPIGLIWLFTSEYAWIGWAGVALLALAVTRNVIVTRAEDRKLAEERKLREGT